MITLSPQARSLALRTILCALVVLAGWLGWRWLRPWLFPPSPRVVTPQLALESLQANQTYDLVSMIQVIAHFADLRQALQVAADATKPSGYWLIETWNKDSWAARLFGQNWHEYSPPSVLHWFSPTTLKALAAQFGFHEIAHGRPSKWINGGHAKSLLQYKLQSVPLGRQAGKLLNLLPEYLPLPYLADDLFWMLLRKK